MFADIIVDIKHEKLDRIFQYRIPEWLKDKQGKWIVCRYYCRYKT